MVYSQKGLKPWRQSSVCGNKRDLTTKDVALSTAFDMQRHGTSDQWCSENDTFVVKRCSDTFTTRKTADMTK